MTERSFQGVRSLDLDSVVLLWVRWLCSLSILRGKFWLMYVQYLFPRVCSNGSVCVGGSETNSVSLSIGKGFTVSEDSRVFVFL